MPTRPCPTRSPTTPRNSRWTIPWPPGSASVGSGWWAGVVGRSVFGVRQEGGCFSWWSYPDEGSEEILHNYFQLDTDLEEIVRRISEADPAAGEAARRWSGLRLLRQDPEECILSFVCSTANSVPRIAYSIGEFCKRFGEPIGEVEGQTYYTFPSAGTLASVDPAHLSRLTSLGF